MEGPMSSSLSKSYLMNDNIVAEEEESGWTDYLDDFSCSNNDNDGGSFVSAAPSLISDAAWNGSDNKNNNISPPLRILNFKRNFKHRKYSYGDDDLEDTASSPVNSPKVSTMKLQMEVNYRRLDDLAASNFLGKQATTSNFSEVVTEEKNEKNNNIGIENRNNNIDDEFIDDLRKRGLCLVPISALMNYLG